MLIVERNKQAYRQNMIGGGSLAEFLGWFRREDSRPAEKEGLLPHLRLQEWLPSSAPLRLGDTAQTAFERWLEQARAPEVEDRQAFMLTFRQRPTLFIGLGDTGRKVLTHVTNSLIPWREDAWPAHVRLLHIDVKEESVEMDSSSVQSHLPTVILYPRLDHLNVESIDWFRGNPHQPGHDRSLGRLAIFADLAGGKHKSKLWPALIHALRNLTNISVYIVADSFSSVGSGMIVDVAHLLRQIAPDQIGRLCLFLGMQHAQWDDGLTLTRRSERAFATLRELQRFQRRRPARFSDELVHWQPEPNTLPKGVLFDDIVLFDGLGVNVGEEYVHDLSQLPAEDGLLPTMADCLIALLNPEISRQFYELWINQAVKVMLREASLENFASVMGSYKLQLPVKEMRRVMECRLVHDFLFDCGQGWFGWEILAEDGCVRQRDQAKFETADLTTVDEFFQTKNLTLALGKRLDKYEFQGHVLDFLEMQLNRESGPRFYWALSFLHTLGQVLPGHKAELEEIARALWQWIEAVNGETQVQVATSDPIASFLGRTIKQTTLEAKLRIGALYQAWQVEWNRARAPFELMARLRAQHTFWDLDQEYKLFQAYIVPQQAVEKMRGYVWWRWSKKSADRPQLKLMILPADLDETDPDIPHLTRRQRISRGPEVFSLSANHPEAIISGLLHLASAFSRALQGVTLDPYLKDSDLLGRELINRSGLLYREQDVNGGAGGDAPFCYFARSKGKEAYQLAGTIQQSVSPHQFRDVSFINQTTCQLFQVVHMLSLPNMTAYAEARKRYLPRPELHVFQAEQIATRWEEKGERKLPENISRLVFSSAFVEHLARDEKALRLYGHCLIYGLIEVQLESMRIIACHTEELEELVETSAHAAVEQFVELVANSPALTERLQGQVSARKPRIYEERVDLLDAIQERLVMPLSQSDNVDAQDLALLLAAVIVEEESEANDHRA